MDSVKIIKIQLNPTNIEFKIIQSNNPKQSESLTEQITDELYKIEEELIHGKLLKNFLVKTLPPSHELN